MADSTYMDYITSIIRSHYIASKLRNSWFYLWGPNLCEFCEICRLAEFNSTVTLIATFVTSRWFGLRVLQCELFTYVSLQVLQKSGHFCLAAWSEKSFVRPNTYRYFPGTCPTTVVPLHTATAKGSWWLRTSRRQYSTSPTKLDQTSL